MEKSHIWKRIKHQKPMDKTQYDRNFIQKKVQYFEAINGVLCLKKQNVT